MNREVDGQLTGFQASPIAAGTIRQLNKDVEKSWILSKVDKLLTGPGLSGARWNVNRLVYRRFLVPPLEESTPWRK